MQTKKCQVLVIGAGPGGYVAAIRAGQLGLSTIIVEGEKAGGTCLIRGCIPSKALIHAAHRFHDLAKHSTKDGHMGISIPGPAELSMSGMVGWKDGIVDKLNKGVEHLLKSAGAELINGWAEFQDAKTVKVGSGKDAILIEGDPIGEVMFYGPGAGAGPTASAVVADILNIVGIKLMQKEDRKCLDPLLSSFSWRDCTLANTRDISQKNYLGEFI